MDLPAATEHLGTSNDAALVRRAALGDAAAFERLMSPRLDRCYRLAWSILSNDADALDATQDALVAAWRALPRLRDPAAFDGWLNRVVANAARMARRHRGRRREVTVPSIDPDEPPPPEAPTEYDPSVRTAIDRVVEADAFARAFERLRPDDRVLLVLHHLEERPVAEIARTLAIPVGTAKSRLHAARRALERALEAEA